MSDPTLAGICSRCGETGYDCKCENFHPNIPTTYEFTIEECRALYRIFEREYLPYEDEEIHTVARRIMKIVMENK